MRRLRDAPSPLCARPDDAAGYPPLRQQVAAYLAQSRAVRCEADQVIVVNGSQQALDLCMRLFADPGDEVALEDPGYPGARQRASAHGVRIRPVGVTCDGLRLADLPDSPRLLHVTPSHQFPKGASMSLARRLELLDWARSRGTVIVEDDYDGEYRLQRPASSCTRAWPTACRSSTRERFRMSCFLRCASVMSSCRVSSSSRSRAPSGSRIATRPSSNRRRSPTSCEKDISSATSAACAARTKAAARRWCSRSHAISETTRRSMVMPPGCTRSSAWRPDIGARAERRRVRMVSADSYYLSGHSPNEFILGFAAVGERTIVGGVRRLAAPLG